MNMLIFVFLDSFFRLLLESSKEWTKVLILKISVLNVGTLLLLRVGMNKTKFITFFPREKNVVLAINQDAWNLKL